MTAVERTIRWRQANPDRYREVQRRYRQGAACREGRRRNSASQNRYHSRYVARLGEGYVRKLLREQWGIPDPTPAEIETHRRRVRLMRSHRTLMILRHGLGTQH